MAIQVQTTHNVVIDYQTASPLKRTIAYFIDWIGIALWIYLCVIIANDVFYLSLSDYDDFNYGWIFPFLIFIAIFCYDLACETLNNGQSMGKFLMRIRVVKLDGSTPSFSEYVLRWVFRPIDFTITYGLLAFIMVAANKNSQRLGDYLAGTTVIDLRVERKNRRLSINDLDFDEDFNLQYPDLLKYLSDKDIQTILAMLDKKNNRKKRELKERIALRIESITGYTYDKEEQASDDYLRAIVDNYHYLATQ